MNTTPTGAPDSEPKMTVVLTTLDRNEFERENSGEARKSADSIQRDGEGMVLVKRGGFKTLYGPDGKIMQRFAGNFNEFLTQQEYEEFIKDMMSHMYGPSHSDTTNFRVKWYIENNIIPKQYQPIYCRIFEYEIDQNVTVPRALIFKRIEDAILVADKSVVDALKGTQGKDVNYFDVYQKAKDKDEEVVFVGSKFDCIKNKKAFHVPSEGGYIDVLDAKFTNPKQWTTEVVRPEEVQEPITGIGLDNKENFLLVGCGHKLYIYDFQSRPLELYGEVFEDADVNFEGTLYCEENGVDQNILVGASDGSLRRISTNFNLFKSGAERNAAKADESREKARALKVAAQLGHLEALRKAAASGATASTKVANIVVNSPMVQEQARQNLETFQPKLDAATTIAGIQEIRKEIAEYKDVVRIAVTDTEVVEAMFKPLMEYVAQREIDIVTPELISEKTRIVVVANSVDAMTVPDVLKLKSRIDYLRTNANLPGVERSLKGEVLDLCDDVDGKIRTVLNANEDRLIQEIDVVVDRIRATLDGFTKSREMEEWVIIDYPQIVDQITMQMKLASLQQTKLQEHGVKAIEKVTRLKREYEKKFREQYDTVQANVAEGIGSQVKTAELLIAQLMEDFSAKVERREFADKDQINLWVDAHPLSRNIEDVISTIEDHDPEKAHALSMKLKIGIAALKSQSKRNMEKKAEVSTGKNQVPFGNFMFNVWEAKAEKLSVNVVLDFKVDDATKGAGVKPNDYMCELVFKTKDKSGSVKEVPLSLEEVRKYGLSNPRLLGDFEFGKTYMTVGEAKKIIAKVKDMNFGLMPDVQAKYEEFQANIRAMHVKIKESAKEWQEADGKFPGIVEAARLKGPGSIWATLLSDRRAMIKQYHEFLDKEGLYVWQKMRSFKEGIINGKMKNGSQGKIPKMSDNPHWTLDEETEQNLEDFATNAKMSLDLRDGMISLEGHAGTGKDVLVSIFCAKTQRPKYTFDCSKWTTEFDLSQDVSLAADGGASYTVKEDSVIVKALETPGAVLYFNEFNAMPQQAQMFLHSLFDEKRQITLKTSQGRIVKAHPSVIICSSMNPDYPETYKPQFATRSRMIPIKVGYPKFKKEDGTFGTSEALRTARSIRSLEDFTIGDISENEFVDMWNAYINRGDETNPLLTPTRKFDIEVIFALLTFGNEIREAFIKGIDGSNTGPDDFTISQPFTMREMRRCAWLLNNMSPSEKEDIGKAEETARKFIRRVYSSYIFNGEEARSLEEKLTGWSTKKPTTVPVAPAVPPTTP
ncbi:MAG: hypothetical protein US92_C0003G0028 [Candidatus Peregrinibacteria bacterium GW2011_GWA2_38_36]|nr:MAG: hypothetical protein US92_C0003G0028 [Candidatus Peregrinibacteria bacterium GW2011_GWA2_38_36]